MFPAQFENKEWKDVDWSRNAAFGLFGLFYLGGIQYFIYGAFDPAFFRCLFRIPVAKIFPSFESLISGLVVSLFTF